MLQALTARRESLNGAVRRGELARPATVVAVAACIFVLAFQSGGYTLNTRLVAGIVVWWTIGLVAAFRPVAPMQREPVIVVVCLLVLGGLASASVTWGGDPAQALPELDRAALYAGVVVLAWMLRGVVTPSVVSDGCAVALTAVAALAVASRTFPSIVPQSDVTSILPLAGTRLNYPVGYWNGLAILTALGIPALVRAARGADHILVRALAAGAIPLPILVAYLASSRTGAIATVIGAALYLALTDERWAAIGILASGAIGAICLVLFVHTRHHFVNGPLQTHAAAREGHEVAAVTLAWIIAVAIVYLLAERSWRGEAPPGRRAGRAAVAIALVLLAAIAALAHPVRRWHEFTAVPPTSASAGAINEHFLSSNGNWRWQYWKSSVAQFRAHPLLGGGIDTFERWWARHGISVGFVQNPHSLYLQVLGELGLIGLLLVAAALGVACLAAIRWARTGAVDGERAARGALAAIVVTFAVVALAADWMWQLTAVSVLGFAAFGAAAPLDSGRAWRWARSALLGVAACALAATAIALVANVKLDDSRAAAARGELASARRAAHTARALEPWSPTPYVQLALVEEQRHRLANAERWIDDALKRDDGDWRTWLIAARIQTERGRIAAARRTLRRAAALDPRSPVFAHVTP